MYRAGLGYISCLRVAELAGGNDHQAKIETDGRIVFEQCRIVLDQYPMVIRIQIEHIGPYAVLTFVGLCRRKYVVKHGVHLLVVLLDKTSLSGVLYALMTFL